MLQTCDAAENLTLKEDLNIDGYYIVHGGF